MELLGRPLPLLCGGGLPLPLIERPTPLGPLLVLDSSLLRGELGLRLLRCRRGLRDHWDLLRNRSDNSGELGLVSGGGDNFVGHPLGCFHQGGVIRIKNAF
ncbi:hypothetical protein QYE76_054577 [Lolium multiflorum]|uniref:Uncharacterized protein n=1 Tax=Lolium multiflorum TaxID=4521 RepID=A0AAD8SXZ8_LOLMU|nr:hypothetical protein QYE76_054577 [Lolium multiflorum]